MTRYTGSQFNQKFKGQEFVKLTTESENHNGLKFKTGRNVDRLPYRPYGSCSPGGLYFCRLEDFAQWLSYNNKKMCYVRKVLIEDDAQVYEEHDHGTLKFKCDKFILSDRVKISGKFLLDAIKSNGNLISKLDAIEQTTEICLAAVRQNGLSLEYIDSHSEYIYSVAVKQNGFALQFVRKQTPAICLAAIKENPYALQFVNNQTAELCLVAVSHIGDTLQFVKKQTPAICFAAVSQDGSALEYVREQTREICLAAVSQDGPALEYVREQTR
jgi:hypothetical protein